MIGKGAKVLLSSHLGRPIGKGFEAKLSLSTLIPRISELLSQKVTFIKDCIGVEVKQALSVMKEGDVCLLENVRFYQEEEINDSSFAEKLG